MSVSEEKNKRFIMSENLSFATFGGGCFWCTEAIFLRINGVKSVVSGYSGGKSANPTYEEVCSGRSGHAEIIQIKYDSSIVAYTDLLNVFFATHDPTTLNRQGADVGTQYRSVIFTHDENQKNLALDFIKVLEENKVYSQRICTEISDFSIFYPAEKYHSNYYDRNPNQGYCRYVILPKIEKFDKTFKALQK